ncbi:helix-turn-helix domain-containing protein [Leifsonia sp. H3M29-4]|uniref:sigma-54-dependent Fis family transcriptional regulator n=1 Tax=Salinibacterium metalliresistens TaxID=3031321 RepID=UPI0023DCD239|nr:helix-turn-helix domain-containing protein [Salinibacterium metalliresistens]MDF1478314.1 helix-turn-helix domain-containing protein [Salinibacterium metalliresistens]
MDDEFDLDRVQSAKEAALSRSHTDDRKLELVDSWKRSQAAIGDPGNIHDVPHVPESVLDEHLLEMFGAPMNRFAEDIEGTGLALLLADSRGQILQRWFEDRQAESHLDRVGTVRGAVLAENVVGTNGVGTVVTLGKPVQIRGTEHYADFYQDAVCTGSPVFHPITRKLFAVVTLSCDLTPRSDLLKPLVRSMATQLEQHLLSVEQPSAREMFTVFLELSRNQSHPVVAFGPQGAMIQSPKASALTSHDMHLLRTLGDENRPTGTYMLELSSGPTTLEYTSIGPNNNVVVVGAGPNARPATSPRRVVRNVGRSPAWLAAMNQFERVRAIGEPVILAGEPGVGKTSLALGERESATAPVLSDAAERHILGTREWLARLAKCFTENATVVIRGIETLDPPALDGMRSLIEAHSGQVAVVMTLSTDDERDAERFELKFGARAVWIPPLRDRVEDLPVLWNAVVAALAPAAKLELQDETLKLLRAYGWPGNLKELRRLVSQLGAAGKSGAVAPTDLPSSMQSSKTLSLIEKVELEAIRKALQEAQGNRVRAADILGISRATVYRKMKAYRLVT